MKNSPFRAWLADLYIQNKEERAGFGFGPITLHEYFNRYKYWLKREYKHQRSQSK